MKDVSILNRPFNKVPATILNPDPMIFLLLRQQYPYPIQSIPPQLRAQVGNLILIPS